MNTNIALDLFFVLFSYFVAFADGLFAFYYFKDKSLLTRSFILDIVATFVIYFFSLLYNNASLYDPYWSVQPVILWILWYKETQYKSILKIVFSFLPIMIWAIRLTTNWAIQRKGKKDQDWRYTNIHDSCPKLWLLTNLVAIQLIPTIIVFTALIPAFHLLFSPEDIGIFSVFGSIVSLIAVIIQFISDKQMIKFRKENAGKGLCIRNGLWKYSRHPNYFGEILFWYGVWIVQLGSTPKAYWTYIGPLVITILFTFISVPLMEEKIKNRPGYKKIQEEIPMLIPYKILF